MARFLAERGAAATLPGPRGTAQAPETGRDRPALRSSRRHRGLQTLSEHFEQGSGVQSTLEILHKHVGLYQVQDARGDPIDVAAAGLANVVVHIIDRLKPFEAVVEAAFVASV